VTAAPRQEEEKVKARKPGRRLLAAASLLVAAALAFVAQASSAPSHAKDSNSITFMVAEYSTKTVPFWKDVVKGFEKANPGMKVNLRSVGWQQNHDTTAQMIAANQLPDLVNTATIWLPEWVKANAILPVTSDIVPAAVQSRFVPSLFSKGAQYQGKIWGLPFAAAARGMFYNKDLYKQAGIASAPATWSQLLAASTRINKKTGTFGFAFDGKGVQAFRYFGYFLWNAGGDFFTPEGKALFNSPQGVRALSFLVKLAKSNSIPDATGLTAEDIEPLFLAQRVANWIDGNYLVPQIASQSKKFAYGVAPVPVEKPGMKPVTWGVTDTLVIGKNANVPLVRKFIDYIYQPSVRTTFDVNEGFLPLLKSQVRLPQFTGNPAVRSFVKLLPYSRFDPLNPHYSQMQQLVTTAMQQALKGSETPKAALDQAAKAFDKLAAQG
jgi:multiple sugar transport system substrate-binding protein